jgi:hypothetical protein
MKRMETKLDRVVGKAAGSVAKVIGGTVLAGFWGVCIVGAIARVLWLLGGVIWMLLP